MAFSIGAICQQYLKDFCVVYPDGDVESIRKRLIEVERKFKMLDSDSSGDLDLEEIAKALGGEQPTEQIKDILSQVDDDNTGTLRLREFINFSLIRDKVIAAPIPEVVQSKLFGAGRRQGAVKKKKRGLLRINVELKKTAAGYDLAASIFEARDLLPMDFNGKADPFVKMYVLPDPKKKTKKKTKVVKCSLSPQWNEEFSWQLPSSTNLKESRLLISMFDWDRITQNDFMGQMAFSLSELAASPATGWYMLLDEKQGARYNFQSRDMALHRAPSKVGAPAPRLSVTPDADRMTEKDFQFIKVLGRGNFGKVFLAENKRTKQACAVKVLKKGSILQENDSDSVFLERNVLCVSQDCHFLAHMVACFQSPANLFFVMDLYTGGDLMFHVLKAGKFSEYATAFYCAEICCGLWYLHGKNIFYRDLKLDNVMLDSEGHVHIADFGLCKDMSGMDPQRTNTFCGTPNYLAPEIVNNDYYGNEVDFWSLGVMVYEMLTGSVLFDADNEDQLYTLIRTQPIHLSRTLSSESRAVISGFLSRDPKARLGYGAGGKDSIKRQAFFTNKFEWGNLEARAVKPPIVPAGGADKAVNFDSEFTSEAAVITPTHPAQLSTYRQDVFDGFSFPGK